MKKTVLSLLLIFVSHHYIFAQVVDEPANWPNTSWTLNGTYEALSLLGNPTIDPNFGFDDNDAGEGSIDILFAESPITDITSAVTAGENFLVINATYTFLSFGDSLTTQYWDADTGIWTNWGDPIVTDTAGAPSFNFCDGPFVAFTTEDLDISSFTPTQLAGFKYRLVYDDGGEWAFGFCFSSPTLSSSTGPAACADITGLSVSNVNSDSATINWNAGGTETAWEIAVQTPGTGMPAGNGQATNTNPYPATGLTPLTGYEVYVRANCNTNGFSNWVGPVNFTTLTTPPNEPAGVTCITGSSSTIFMEEFGQVEEVAPLGWTGTGFDGDINNVGNWSITIQNTNTPGTGPEGTWDNNPGVHLEYEASDLATTIASAITPPIDMLAAEDGAELSFYMHAYGSAIGTLNIGVGTSPTGPFSNAFSWNGQFQTSDTDAWIPVGVNLDAFIGQIIYLEFSYGATGTADTGDLAIDAIKVESCGDFCIKPSALAASNLMTTSADIGWDANGTETNWEYVVQPAGAGTPAGSGTATTTNPVTATGLNPSTIYEVYVRANCLGDGFSLWEGPIRFTTLSTPPPPPAGVTCTDGTLTDVFTEGFGVIENMEPAGWTGSGFDGNVLNGDWRITNPNENTPGTGPLNSWDSSPGVHLEYEGGGNSTNVASAITPAIDLTSAAGSAELSFYMHAFGASIGELNVGIGLSATGPFTNIFTWSGGLQIADSDAWVPVGVNIDGAVGQTIFLEFAYSGTGAGITADIALDEIKVESCIVACAPPSNLIANNITANSVDLSWTANAGESNWEYVVQTIGTGVPAGNGTASTAVPETVNTLSPATGYEVYLRANCLTDGFSEWVGPIIFTTLNDMPPPAPTGVNCVTGTSTIAFEEDFGLTQNTDPSGWTGTGFNGENGNWRITDPGANGPGTGPLNSWDNNLGVHLEYESSGSATNIASAVSPAIDLSAAVDGAELSFYMHAFGSGIGALSVGVSTSVTGPFTTEYAWAGPFQASESDAWVPVGVNLDAYLGQTIFIEFAYGGNGTSSFGDIAIDTIKVESCGNFCLAPTNLAATNITLNSASISWMAGDTETNWEYVVQPSGTGLPTGSGNPVMVSNADITGLDPATEYEVYVRANCLTNGFSNWVGPITFISLKVPPAAPVGVDCTGVGSSVNVFTETFGTIENQAPTGWTGSDFDGQINNGNWMITNPNSNTENTGPFSSWDGMAGVHMEYDASNNEDNIAKAITPLIDLSESANSAELSFYMHAYGLATGTLNVGVSASATGPFTNVFTWVGNLQGIDTDDWAHVGVNLDAYIGEMIYIEFSYGADGSNVTGDLALDQINVEACMAVPPTCDAPSTVTVDSITDTSASISWTVNNGESEWEYVVVPSGTTPPASGTTVTAIPVLVTGLDPNTDYDVYVLANCSATLESDWAGPIPFTTLGTPPNCDAPSAITVDSITDTSASISWTVNNGESEWEYVVVPSGTAPPASGTTVTAIPVLVTGLDPNTDYDVYVLANCSAGLESDWAGPIPFTTFDSQINVINCNDAPLVVDYCYTNDNLEILEYASSNGQPLNLVFNTGFVEDVYDFLVVTDTDGTELYRGFGNSGNLSGLNFQSTGNSISFTVQSDISNSCEDGAVPYNDGINYTLSCATCINPSASYVVRDNCSNEEFFIDTNIIDLGSALSLIITDNLGSAPVNVSSTGITSLGPYNFGVDVSISIVNAEDSSCSITRDFLSIDDCIPENDSCISAIEANVNQDDSCNIINSGTLLGATSSGESASCAVINENDVWYKFVALESNYIISTVNVQGGFDFELNYSLYEGVCGSLTELQCVSGITSNSMLTPTLTIGNTYYYRVSSTIQDITSFDVCIKLPPSNTVCQDSIPFCGSLITSNSVGFPDGGTLGCLQTTPNPVWNTLVIGESGNIVLQIEQNTDFDLDGNPIGTPLDVDFILWGPFNEIEAQTFCEPDILDTDCGPNVCPNNTNNPTFYPSGNIMDCSYDPAVIETATIPNAIEGEIYLLLVTNFSDVSGEIQISQIAGSGGIEVELAPVITSGNPDYPIVDEDNDPTTPIIINICDDVTTLELMGSSPFAENYQWYADGVAVSGATSPNYVVSSSSGTNRYQLEASTTLCSSDTQFGFSTEIIVNFLNKPTAEVLDNITTCDDGSGDGIEAFNLEAQTPLVLGIQDPTEFVVTYHISLADAETGINPLTPIYIAADGTEIYVRIENLVTVGSDSDCINTDISFTLHISGTTPDVVNPNDLTTCDDSSRDGFEFFDLTSNTLPILGGLNPADFTVTYYASQTDAQTQMNALSSPYENVSNPQTIFARVNRFGTVGCFKVVNFDLIVNDIPETTFDSSIEYKICPGSITPIKITAAAENYTESDVAIQWYFEGIAIPDATELELTNVIETGTYTITVTFDSTRCFSETDVIVTEFVSCNVPQGISPNGDGLNDSFDLSSFNVQSLEIYNRNGTLVYSKRDYINEWKGQSNAGDDLPVGTYYYIMKFKGDQVKSAWVYINK